MSIKIALAGNPNCGKTTLFNALTGSNQFVGNWPGVTVEKKEGKWKEDKEVIIMDLPGIYSLSPYTLEEVVSRNYLISERPDAILNIIDGTNLERNLYLTTQLLELGIPTVIAVNMMDLVQKSGDKIKIEQLSKELGCEVIEISALKENGIEEAVKKTVAKAKAETNFLPQHKFDEKVETYLLEISTFLESSIKEEQKKFYAIKLFERDDKISNLLENVPDVEAIIKRAEEELEDDSESIITNERYAYISSIIKDCYTKKKQNGLSISDKIDKIVTNRFLALPIFAVIMLLVYYVSVTTVGGIATDWVNDGVFGDGWHLFGIGSSSYEKALEEYEIETAKIDAFLEEAKEQGISTEQMKEAISFNVKNYETAQEAEEAQRKAEEAILTFQTQADFITAITTIENEDGEVQETYTVTLSDFLAALPKEEPDQADYGAFIPGIPVLLGNLLERLGTANWLNSLILDGIVAGVGAVLGFVPQMLILFLFLAFLEACGYMARIAFIMDRIFRKFGLSGKSFIPMLIGTGCGVPGIMASRTIENDRDRKITIMTTTFIPCSAKLPIIALIAGALFHGAWWVAPSAYFIGILAIITSGIILKKTKLFSGDAAPFVMELPAYHWPTIRNVLRSMWERGSSFIKKAGTIILLSTIFVWFTSNFGIVNGKFTMVDDLSNGFLAGIGRGIAWIFTPLGWGNWQAAVAAITGLIAKENVVGTFGVLYGFSEVAENGSEIWGSVATNFTAIASYSFLVFNLLCAPCFAAMGAIKREMNHKGWFWFAIGYQTIFAYAVSFCIYQIGSLFIYGQFGLGQVTALIFTAGFLYLLFRPYKENKQLKASAAAN